jgi:hypothetical protein
LQHPQKNGMRRRLFHNGLATRPKFAPKATPKSNRWSEVWSKRKRLVSEPCRGCRERFGPMDDISAIAGLIISLRSAVEITKAMMDIGDSNTLQTKILDLTREIMSAQSYALATQSAQLDLSQSNRCLEDELAKLKAWNLEKYRYELQTVGSGAVAYVLKLSMRGTEPIHWICANCFQIGKKRFLNESHSDLHFVYYKCQECAGKIRLRKAPQAPESDLRSFESAASSTSSKECEQQERMSPCGE